MNNKVIGAVVVLIGVIGSAALVYGNQNKQDDNSQQQGIAKVAAPNKSDLGLNLLPLLPEDVKSGDNKTRMVTNANTTMSATLSNLQPVNSSSVTAPELQARLDTIHKRRPDLNLTVAQLQVIMDKPDAWHTDNSQATKLADKLKPGDAEDGRVFIRFDPLKIETLIANDRLQVPIPHMDKTYTMLVSEVDNSDPDITVWRGKLEDFNGINRVNIVQGHENGETVTHIGINTPQGFYVTDVFDDKGWIVPGGTLTNKGGEVVVPIDEHGIEGKPEYHGQEKTIDEQT